MINITTDQKARRPERTAMLRQSYATAERAWVDICAWIASFFLDSFLPFSYQEEKGMPAWHEGKRITKNEIALLTPGGRSLGVGHTAIGLPAGFAMTTLNLWNTCC